MLFGWFLGCCYGVLGWFLGFCRAVTMVFRAIAKRFFDLLMSGGCYDISGILGCCNGVLGGSQDFANELL